MTEAWDYTEDRWDYRRDGYVKVERFGRIIYERPATPDWTCELCGQAYTHFFVSNLTWNQLVPPAHRAKKLCPRCYAGV